MSLKPEPPRPMPEDLARLGRILLPETSPYRLIGDRLYATYRNADFADWYHAEGRPGLQPVDLVFVLAFQALEQLGDRAAAEALRVRLDWKYALHLPLDAPGFNFSVLSEFRDRLIAHNASARLFDRLLDDLRDLGLLKRRGRQRTDSLAIHSQARHLTRLELVAETLRLATRAIVQADPAWAQATFPPTWEASYGERVVVERLSVDARARLEAETGRDGQWLLDRIAAPTTPPTLATLAEVVLLGTVWHQQYLVSAGQVVWRDVHGGYDGATQVQTPHDPEARWSTKRSQSWVGDKLQVSETDDDDAPHLITDIALTSSVEGDTTALAGIAERQAVRGVLPSERFVDQGYMGGDTLVAAAKRGEDLIGPVALRDPSPQARMTDGLTQDQFQIAADMGTATCPNGATAIGRPDAHGDVRFQFATEDCRDCPLRARCCGGARSRSVRVSHGHAAVVAARARQATDAFKAAYRAHRGGVEGCLSALVRGHRIRVNRYIGRAKNQIRVVMIGVAVNLRRSARWLAGERPQVRRSGLELAPAGS